MVLKDPKNVFGFQNVAPVVSQKVLTAEGPAFGETLNAVSSKLTDEAMRKMNAAVRSRQAEPGRCGRGVPRGERAEVENGVRKYGSTEVRKYGSTDWQLSVLRTSVLRTSYSQRMALTVGSAPFGQHPAGEFNREMPPFKGLIYFEDSPRWIRARFAGETVVDSRHAKLLHEHGHLPIYYFPEEDLRADLLEPSDHTSHCPWKGDASYWSVRGGRAGGRERRLGL